MHYESVPPFQSWFVIRVSGEWTLTFCKKMLRTLITLLIALSYPVGYAGERPVEIDSHESAFHIMLHDGAGFCLVCYTEVMKKPWRGEWEKLKIE